MKNKVKREEGRVRIREIMRNKTKRRRKENREGKANGRQKN